jgi:hypothetical protein
VNQGHGLLKKKSVIERNRQLDLGSANERIHSCAS